MNRALIILIISLLLTGKQLNSQSPVYKVFSGSLEKVKSGGVNAGSFMTFNNTGKTYSQSSYLRERNTEAKIYFILDLGSDYVKKNSGAWNFKVQVDFSYVVSGNGSVAKSLVIDQNTPEVMKIDDLLLSYGMFPPSTPPTINVNITNVTIDDGAQVPAPLTGFLKNYVDSNLRFTVKFARGYDVDVRLQSTVLSNAPAISAVTKQNRKVTFNWQPVGVDAYPNYELQVLKLENKHEAEQSSKNKIITVADWSRALKIETQSHETNFSMNIAEGTGFYIWRVRPIGTYYPGGIGNSENYGLWSYSFQQLDSVRLDSAVLYQSPGSKPYAFYFKDPDEKLNWIYDRVFTEGDFYDKENPTGVKASEGITYADGLSRIRQIQKYNSSNNTNIVSQTILDYAGRPLLTTIPVPVNNGLTGYKKKFVRTAQDSLYRAEFFDSDAKLNNPDRVQDNGSSAFKYYSDSTTSPYGIDNTNVPDAEGYLFSRKILSNDGTGHILEESGVGKRHSIGSQTNDQGRTKRVNYSVPSDDELIRIFGEEAPLAESVIKTMTTDENNVTSIVYTSKEGNTIATALYTRETDNLTELDRPVDSLVVKNSVVQRILSQNKVSGSKSIVFSKDTTEITLSYINDQMPNPGSGCVTGNCNLKLRFYIVDVTRGKTFISDADNVTGITDFNSSTSFSFPNGWRFVNKDPIGTPLVLQPYGTPQNKLKLPAGSYVFIKELFSGNSANYGDSIANAAYNRTKPVIDAITARMQDVNSSEKYTAFLGFMDTLKMKMNDYYANVISSNDLLLYLKIDSLVPLNYTFPDSSDFRLGTILPSPSDPMSNNVEMSTSCCGSMKVPIPKLNICLPCDGHPAYTGQPAIAQMITENNLASVDSILPWGVNDFLFHPQWSMLNDSLKRDAIYKVVDRNFIDLLKDKFAEEGFSQNDLWKYAPGFSFNSLNFMISNMLISEYYTGMAIRDTIGQWHKLVVSNGNYVMDSLITAMDHPLNYDCKSIYTSWFEAVTLINSFEVGNSTDNVVNAFNNYEGNNSAQDEADDEDNYEELSKRQKKKLKKKLGKELEDFSNSNDGQMTQERKESITNLVSTFIGYAGYQFAAIIDGDSIPGYITSSNGIYPTEYIKPYSFLGPISGQGSGFDFPLTTGFPPVDHTEQNATFLFKAVNNAPVLTMETCNGNSYSQLYYPYIVKPEWMFKYYVYNKFTNETPNDFISDSSYILPHQVLIDVNRNYNEPYSYLPSAVTNTLTPDSVCSITPVNQYQNNFGTYNFSVHHLNWDMAERNMFYEMIRGSAKCYKTKGIPKDSSFYQTVNNAVQVPSCPTKYELICNARNDLNARMIAVDDLREAIKAALRQEFISSCYSIISCKTGPMNGVVSEKEIDYMAGKVINYAKSQIAAIKSKFLALDTVSNFPACASLDSTINSYNDSLCSLPFCWQVNCYDMILMDDNTLSTTKSVRLGTKYYTDCDQKILDMLQIGAFLPYIPPLTQNCPKAPKQWMHVSCGTGSTPCGTNPPLNTYSEKTTCSPADYKRYTQTYKITASN